MDDILDRHFIDKKKLYTGIGKGRPYTVNDFKRIFAIEMAKRGDIFSVEPSQNSLVDEKIQTFKDHLQYMSKD